MRIILFCFLVFGSVISYAQDLAMHVGKIERFSSTSVGPVAVQSNPIAVPGTRMRNTGRTLTIVGIPLLIGGIVMASSAESTQYTYTSTQGGSYEEGDPKGAVGALMAVGGAGMMVPGIILWSKGAKKMKRYNEIEGISLDYTGSTVALRVRL